MTPCSTDFDIAGVTLASAMQWLRGERWATRAVDLDTSQCEVAFLNELGNRASWRAGSLKMLELFAAGATCAIAHVTSPIVLAHYKKFDGEIVLTEKTNWRGQELNAWRVFIPPAGTRRWVEKLTRETRRKKENLFC